MELNPSLFPGIAGKRGKTFHRRLPLLLTGLLLFLACTTRAQTVSLTLNKGSLESAFQDIQRQTGYQFVYTREQLQKANPVTLSLRQAPLAKALEALFQNQPLNYQVEDNHIIVRERPTATPPASTRSILGMVQGEDGTPVPGATIRVKGKSLMTQTRADGRFELHGLAGKERLLVSSVGFLPRELPVEGEGYYEIRLTVAVASLDETIVMAYGTTTRRLSTGNIAKVSGEEIAKQPVSNPIATLQGRVAGLSISQTSGVAGSSFRVNIRGLSALDLSLSRSDPLFIIDGVPFEPGNLPTNQLVSAANNPTSISQGGISPLNTLPPSDIESIEVLKDADATAIYGSRGANGVILITTKKGKSNKTTGSAGYTTGWSKARNSFDLLNTSQYLAMRREGFANEGRTPTTTTAPDLLLWDTTRYTDLRQTLTGHTARMQLLQVSLSGGTGNTRFFFNGSYRKETSVFSTELNDRIASARLGIQHATADKKLQLQWTAGYSEDRNRLLPYDLTRYIALPPNLKLYDSLGRLAWEDNGVPYHTLGDGLTNPLAELKREYQSRNRNLLANFQGSYALLPQLKLTLSAGYNFFLTDEVTKNPSTSLNPFFGQLPSAQFAQSRQHNWIVEPQLEWNRRWQQHRVGLLIGSTLQSRQLQSEALTASGYANDLLLNSLAAAAQVMGTSNISDYRYTAFFGRLHYDYAGRFLLNLSGRRDGSSRFGPQRRFASFGAIGAGWVFSSERWFTPKWISFGKLRGSYGVTGNDQIGDYRFLPLWSSQNPTYGGIPGVVPRSLFNPDYNWEKTGKLELALELHFFKDRLQTSVAYYRNRSSNQLVNYTLPAQTGFSSVVRNLPALVENQGLEWTLSASPIRQQHLSWTLGFNLTIPNNTLLSFPGLATSPYASQYVVGQPLSVINRLRYLGVDSASGLYTFEDVDKDGLLTVRDY